MGSPLGAANYNPLLLGAANLERLGTTVHIQYIALASDAQIEGKVSVTPKS